MVKDKRYKTLKNQIEGGFIRTFNEIIDVVPKTRLARDLKIHNQKFDLMLEDVTLFDLVQLYRLADLIEVDGLVVMGLAHAQKLAQDEEKKKGRKRRARADK